MDEIELMAIIGDGESEMVDFKREIHLDTKEEKGEFVKDVVSIANSAPGKKGYILVGIDDNKLIVGSANLEEERIQQIIHGYVRPPIKLRCSILPIHVVGFLSVGVIEIESLDRPHRVVRPIGNLNQDDVFVRNGSVVTKATVEQIQKMTTETGNFQLTSQFIQAAETHFRLGNFKEAINSYTKAIDAMPTSDLFLARGRAHGLFAGKTKLSKNRKFSQELAKRAYKDFSDAITIADSQELEKITRLERLRLYNSVSVDYAEWLNDIEWLKLNARGYEKGEVLYLEQRAFYDRRGIDADHASDVILAMNQAIGLGFDIPGVFELRAIANFHLCNYGLALNDAEITIKNSRNPSELGELYSLQANIQAKMGRFKDAYASLKLANQIYPADHTFRDDWGYIGSGVEEDLLWHYALAYELGDIKPSHISTAVFQALLLGVVSKKIFWIEVDTRSGEFYNSGSEMRERYHIDEQYSEIIETIKRGVGDDFWRECEKIAQYGSLQWKIERSK